uniref:DDB1- and CUL4-associated factor 15 WD40 repeat-containing domain-containing protein n=1 Tax=Timema bartmani TaxID=61472 RepID=A0A7R9F732_9NEOP|nr:unnamed protein product [Timema bartmani]
MNSSSLPQQERKIDLCHVFLGLSKCGQFLLSYTYTADMDVVPFNTVYKYRLHWWTFVPHQKSRKVAEVMLFGNQGVYSTLLITVCQWPMDHTKVLVYGNCFESYPGSTSQAERSYLTVTTVPFLNKCQDCIKVAASYEEEDVAATWDSCLRFSCLQHGLTVHTTFDVVSPYPKFNPKISLKYEGAVVFNTGSLLYILKIDLEHINKSVSIPSSRTCDLHGQNSSSKPSPGNVSRQINYGVDLPISISSEEDGFHDSSSNINLKEQSSINIHSRVSSVLSYENNSDTQKEDYGKYGAITTPTSNINRKGLVTYCKHESAKVAGEIDANYFDSCEDSLSSSESQPYSNIDLKKCNLEKINDLETHLFCAGKNLPVIRNCCDDSATKENMLSNLKSIPSEKESKSLNNSFDDELSRDVPNISERLLSNCNESLSVLNTNKVILSNSNSKTSALKGSRNIKNNEKQNVFNNEATKRGKTSHGTPSCDISEQHTSTNNVPSVTVLSKSEEASSANCLKNLESLTIREKAVKNFCQDVFNGRITRSLAMRISTEAQSLTEDCTSGNSNDDPVLMSGGQPRLSNDCPNKTQNSSADSSQELNITCGILTSGFKENVDNSLEMLPSPNSLLIINPSSVESEGVDSQTVFGPKRRELGCATPPRIRRTRSGNLPGKFGGSLLVPAPTPAAGTRQRNKMAAEAEKAYEFTEDVSETSCEKLSSFRRRRLADKKYEFCEEEDEDAENIVPYRLHRRRESPPRLSSPTRHYSPSPLVSLRRKLHDEPLDLLTSPRSPNSPYSEIHPQYLETDKVLRPLNRNTASAILLSPRDRDTSTDWPTKAISKKLCLLENVVLPEHEGWDNSVPHVPALLKATKKEISNPNTQTNSGNDLAKCTVEFKRRFIEVDDELVSVITDIEDDDLSEITGYHSALPLEVHGAGYMQLQMISNSKAEKLMAPCVLVQQRSFDVEKFCHEVAEWLCEESGKKYWFCNDYDVEIVDVCPFSGDVIALAVMRIQATIKTKGLAKRAVLYWDQYGNDYVCRNPVSSLQRKQYQGGCKFVWNIVTGKHSVVEVDPLTEFGSLEDCEPWNPARGMAKNLHENLPQIPMSQSVRFITNQLVLKGVTLEYLSDMENMIGLVLEGDHQKRL